MTIRNMDGTISSTNPLHTVLTGSNASTDGSATPAIQNMLYNDSTSSWNRQRGNTQGTLLASSVRTVTTTSPDQTNYNARGVIVYLNISLASGTGGLSVRIWGKDPVTGSGVVLNAAPTAITATGIYGYVLYPGIGAAAAAGNGGMNQVTSEVLPRTWFVQVTHGDGSSYTYSVGYALIL